MGVRRAAAGESAKYRARSESRDGVIEYCEAVSRRADDIIHRRDYLDAYFVLILSAAVQAPRVDASSRYTGR
jgi:hypothetical protein